MINSMLDNLILWLTIHPYFSICIAFFVSFLESIAIIGLIIPGSMTMSWIGLLIVTGVVPKYSTIIAAIIGAIIGDGISYLIGYKYKESILHKWPINKYPKTIKKGKEFIVKYGILSIFLGRFIGPIRAIIPLIAGMFNMTPKKYFIASIPSGILWAPSYILPGAFLGFFLTEIKGFIQKEILIIFFITIFFSFFSIKLLKLIRYNLINLIYKLKMKYDNNHLANLLKIIKFIIVIILISLSFKEIDLLNAFNIVKKISNGRTIDFNNLKIVLSIINLGIIFISIILMIKEISKKISLLKKNLLRFSSYFIVFILMEILKNTIPNKFLYFVGFINTNIFFYIFFINIISSHLQFIYTNKKEYPINLFFSNFIFILIVMHSICYKIQIESVLISFLFSLYLNNKIDCIKYRDKFL